MHQLVFDGRALRGPADGAQCSQDPLAVLRKWEGRVMGRRGEGEGKAPHPSYKNLGPATESGFGGHQDYWK